MARQPTSAPENVFPLPGKTKRNYPDILFWEPALDLKLSPELVQRGASFTAAVKNEYASCSGPSMMVPLLKHWTALPALSYFLTNAMHIRETSRRIQTPCVFKPPPRVTLTDAKREAWLEELANPEVPLRKLARTIPHGVSNTALLEAVFAKNVPIPRAVWFVRCVGSNELRTIKRKLSQKEGQAPVDTESQFLEQWTQEVLGHYQQVLESYNPETAESWQSKIAYTTRHMVQMYHEELLDRTAVIKWIINGVARAPCQHLPVFLFLVDIMWAVMSREPLVLELVPAIAERFASLDAVDPLLAHEQLDAALYRILEDAPCALVLPRKWPMLGPILHDLAAHNSELSARVENLGARNEAFLPGPPPECKKQALAGEILDAFQCPKTVLDVYNELRALRLPTAKLVSTLLTWASQRNTYDAPQVCVCILRSLRHAGSNVQEPLTQFLLDYRGTSTIIYDIVTDLIRANLLCLREYLRRLIASGVLYLPGERQERQRALLRNLPFCLFQRALKNQVCMFLRLPASFSEESVVEPLLAQYNRDISCERPPDIGTLVNLTKNQELVLASRITARYRSLVEEGKLSLNLFSVTLAYLYVLRDRESVMGVLSTTIISAKTVTVLVSAIHNFNAGALSFLCMGTAHVLVRLVLERARALKVVLPRNHRETNLLLSLARSVLKDPEGLSLTEQVLDQPLAASLSPEECESDLVDPQCQAQMEAAMLKMDIETLFNLKYLRPGNAAISKGVVMRCAKNAQDDEFIICAVANRVLDLEDVRELFGRRKLFARLLLQPMVELNLTASQFVSLALSRKQYATSLSEDEVTELFSPDVLRDACNSDLLLLNTIIFTHQHAMVERVILPQLHTARSHIASLLGRVLCVDLEDAQNRSQVLRTLVAKADGFNMPLIQAAVACLYQGVEPREVAEKVILILQDDPSSPTAWYDLFFHLGEETQTAIAAGAEASLLSGHLKPQNAKLVCSVLESLAASSPSLQDQEDKLVEYVPKVVGDSSEGLYTPDELLTTCRILLKLVLLPRGGEGLPPGLRKVLVEGLQGLAALPLCCENSELRVLIQDGLRLLQHTPLSSTDPASLSVQPSALDGLIMYSRSQDSYKKLNVWPFDLLESANPTVSVNDLPLDLARFETYIEIKDPF